MKKIVLVFTFIMICLVLYNGFYTKDSICVSQVNENSVCNQAIVNSYLDRIRLASDEFYSDYYIKSPSVMYYTVNVKEIVSEKSNSIITFMSFPYLGPHDTIGTDEITFEADYMGNVKLKEFKHIKSYYLPDNLKHLEKKKVPGTYE